MISKYLKLIIVFVVLIVVSASVLVVFHKKEAVKKVHYHAGFVVFKDNKQVDFSDFKYMVVKPCTTDKTEEKESNADNQIEKAHLHDLIGDVVHVERENAKWSDLFTNLKYTIDYKNTSAYLNGKNINDFQNLVIQPYDSLVVLIGENDTKNVLTKAVSVDHIKKTEKRSENCGS